MKSLSISLR